MIDIHDRSIFEIKNTINTIDKKEKQYEYKSINVQDDNTKQQQKQAQKALEKTPTGGTNNFYNDLIKMITNTVPIQHQQQQQLQNTKQYKEISIGNYQSKEYLTTNYGRLSRCLKVQKLCCTSIDPDIHSMLIDLLLSYNFESPIETLYDWCELVISMCTYNPRFIERVLVCMFSTFLQPTQLERFTQEEQLDIISNDEIKDDTVPLLALNAKKQKYTKVSTIHDTIHIYIEKQQRLVPQSTSTLLKVIVDKFPHRMSKLLPQRIYIKNLLRISEYAESIRNGILSAIVERQLQIDVEIDCDSSNARNMFKRIVDESIVRNVSDNTTSTSVTTDLFHPEVCVKQDSQMCLLLEYLRLVGTLSRSTSNDTYDLDTNNTTVDVNTTSTVYNNTNTVDTITNDINSATTATVNKTTCKEETCNTLKVKEEIDILPELLHKNDIQTTKIEKLSNYDNKKDKLLQILDDGMEPLLPSEYTQSQQNEIHSLSNIQNSMQRTQNKDIEEEQQPHINKYSQQCDEIFTSLQSVFNRTVQRAERSHFVQFQQFYHCQYKFEYCEVLQRMLAEKVVASYIHTYERATCAQYISSFVCHATYIRQASIISSQQVLLNFALHYTSTYIPCINNDNITTNINTEIFDNSNKKRKLNYLTISPQEANKHTQFYAVCESIFYIFVKRSEIIRSMYTVPQLTNTPIMAGYTPNIQNYQYQQTPILASACLPSIYEEMGTAVDATKTPEVSCVKDTTAIGSITSTTARTTTISTTPTNNDVLSPFLSATQNSSNTILNLLSYIDDTNRINTDDTKTIEPESSNNISQNTKELLLQSNDTIEYDIDTTNQYKNNIQYLSQTLLAEDPLQLGILVESVLNPLLFCSPKLVQEFSKCVKEMHLYDCEQRIKENQELFGITKDTRKVNFSSMIPIFRNDSKRKDTNLLSRAHMPFNPYFLPNEVAYFSGIYRL